MATLTIQQLTASINWATAAGGGDAYANSGEEHLLVLNNSAGTLRVRFEAQTQPSDPFNTVPDVDVSVAAGALVICKAVRGKWFNDGAGRVQLTYPDGVTSLNVAALSIPAAEVF